MSINRRTLLSSGAALMLAASPSRAQSWPGRAINLIVPFPAGGPTDTVARKIAEAMQASLGQPVTIENIGGAGGGLGMSKLARSAPDGYTIGLGTTGTQAINPAIYESLPYDPAKDFAPISILNKYANMMVVSTSSGLKSVADVVDYANKNPDKATFASSGIGASNHLAGEMFKAASGAPLRHVPYKGSAPAIIDVLSGTITFMFDTLSTTLPHIEAGKLVPIGFASPERSPFMPDVPAVAETFPGFDVTNWMAIFAPAGTSPEILTRLQEEIAKATRSEPVMTMSKNLGFASTSSTAAETQAIIDADKVRYADVVKAIGLKL